jgi:hypothetical protein
MSAIDRNLEIAVAGAHEQVVLESLAEETHGRRRAGASIRACGHPALQGLRITIRAPGNRKEQLNPIRSVALVKHFTPGDAIFASRLERAAALPPGCRA